jgi:hypothetical protein
MSTPLPGCMIGPSEPCEMFQEQTATIARQIARAARAETSVTYMREQMQAALTALTVGTKGGQRWEDWALEAREKGANILRAALEKETDLMGNTIRHIARECRTPGTKYGTDMTTRLITLTIDLPLDLLSGLGTRGERQLEADFHRAVLGVVETIFRDRWKHISGNKINGVVMPKNWHDL